MESAESLPSEAFVWKMGQPGPDGTWRRIDMDKFFGHVIPGSFFLVWSIWWALNVISKAVRCNTEAKQKAHVPRAWYPLSWAWHAEPIFKIIFPCLGFIDEFQAIPRLTGDDGRFLMDRVADWQHSAMYLMALVSGIVDLIGSRRRLPRGTEHAFLGLAFVGQSIMFYYHIHPPELEVRAHTLQFGNMVACSIFIFAEVFSRHMAVSIGKAFFLMMTGLWFLQMAFMLYNGSPAWDPNYDGSVMYCAVSYCMYLLLVAILFLAAYIVLDAWYGNQSSAYMPAKKYESEESEDMADEVP